MGHGQAPAPSHLGVLLIHPGRSSSAQGEGGAQGRLGMAAPAGEQSSAPGQAHASHSESNQVELSAISRRPCH